MTVEDLRRALEAFEPHDRVAVGGLGTDITVHAPQPYGPRCVIDLIRPATGGIGVSWLTKKEAAERAS